MIKTIVQKELKELLRDTRFKVSLFIVVVLLVIAGFTSFKQYKTIVTQYKNSIVSERKVWDSQEDKNPHRAAHGGTYVFKPRYALSLFDNGINSYTGNVVFLEAHKRNEGIYSEASDQTEFSRFGRLTLNFVLIYLFPLLIVLIGYNSVSKEIEFDTLRLMKSQGVKPLHLILGKWFSIFLPVFLVCIIVFTVMGIMLSLTPILEYFSWLNLLVLLVTFIFYYAIITTITLLISLLSKSSGISLVSNLSFWVLFCFISPKIATSIANNLDPYPTKQEFYANIQKDKDKGYNGHDPNNKILQEFQKGVLKKYGIDSIQQLEVSYRGLALQKSELEASKIYKKHYNNLKEVFEAQNSTYQKMAILSPFIPTRFFSMDLSNTGYMSGFRFSDAAANYRLEVQKFLNDDFRDNGKEEGYNYKMKSEKFKNLPKFNYMPAGLETILQWNVNNMLILLFWLITPFILLIRFLKKI